MEKSIQALTEKRNVERERIMQKVKKLGFLQPRDITIEDWKVYPFWSKRARMAQKWRNQVLHSKAHAVSLPLSPEDRLFAEAMYKFVEKRTPVYRPLLYNPFNWNKPLGLAAPQLGMDIRMIGCRLRINELEPSTIEQLPAADDMGIISIVLINPVYLSVSEEMQSARETCLSVTSWNPGKIERHKKVEIRAYCLEADKEVVVRANNNSATILQHEMDHLNGILHYDRLREQKNMRNQYTVMQ